MTQAFFNGISGLYAFSQRLNVISDNIANMNTPGFRGNETFFRSVTGANGQGLGTQVGDNIMRTRAGQFQKTGNSGDVAIAGLGFFILHDEAGRSYYSRAGQFEFDKDGFLHDPASGFKVSGIDASGRVTDISIAGNRNLPATATTHVDFNGTLPVSGPPSTDYAVKEIKVFDATGGEHVLSIAFSKAGDNAWNVKVSDDKGKQIAAGVIHFNTDGSPATGGNTLTVELPIKDGKQQIRFNFGDPGSFSGTTQVSQAPTASISVAKVDGNAVAGLLNVGFDEHGVLQFTYNNGEKRTGAQLALADVGDERALRPAQGGAMFQAPSNMKVVIGRPGSAQFGQTQGGYIELSNVDLAQEFGDILILQRGYQASSRVMSVANEMLEQLYNSTRG